MVEIYSLADPNTGNVRYIGKATCSAKRLKSHLRDSKRRKTPVYVWIAELLAARQLPVMAVIDRVSELDWPDRERQLIAHYREVNGDLLNVAAGGNEPFCPKDIRAVNGRLNAAARNQRLWKLKRELGSLLKSGHVSETTKQKMRARPDVFGQFAGYL